MPPGKTIGMSVGAFLLKAVFILSLMAGMFLLLNHKWLGTYAGQFNPQSGDTAEGNWVGIVEAYKPSGEKLPNKTAVLEFNLHLNDPFLKGYQGKGKLFLAGDTTLRFFKDVNFMINPKGNLSGDSFSEIHSQDLFGFHHLSGTFQANALSISALEFATTPIVEHCISVQRRSINACAQA
ncbi:hypothetical protein [Granulicella mallensis]|nr:hypothetical protein [Granulicella mallensis]